jgi:hypothetical protein
VSPRFTVYVGGHASFAGAPTTGAAGCVLDAGAPRTSERSSTGARVRVAHPETTMQAARATTTGNGAVRRNGGNDGIEE